MAVPMKNGGMKTSKVILYVILSGVTTGVGAFFGALIGGISQSIIAICLAFAGGAMIYIVSGELIPEANSLYHGKMTAIGNILGLLIGIFAMTIWHKIFWLYKIIYNKLKVILTKQNNLTKKKLGTIIDLGDLNVKKRDLFN